MPATAIRWSSAPASTIATVEKLFREHWPTSAAVYLPGGKVPEPNSLFTNVKHAETYERILKEAEAGGGGRVKEIERARRAWSQGFVAEAIDEFCRTNEVMDVSGRPHKGVLTAQDMATWLPTLEEPIHLDYGNYRVLKPHAWTQGPVLLQMLALLKGYRPRQAQPHRRRLHPHLGRVRQARLCRPRGLLRRSEVRRRADGDAAVGALQRGAAQARRRRGIDGAAPRQDRRPRRPRHRQGRARCRRRCRRAHLRAPAHRPWRRRAGGVAPAAR